MIFNRETRLEKYDRMIVKFDTEIEKQRTWHRWFAWRPVRIHAPNFNESRYRETRKIAWLQYVERKNSIPKVHYGETYFNNWIYREIQNAK